MDIGVAATSSGALVYTGAAATLDKNINILGNGSDTVQNSGSGLLTLSGNLTKTGTTLTLKGGANGITISGVIQGTNTLFNSDLIVDGGTTNLTNANTYEGPTFIINGATLNANAADALPTANGRTLINLDQSGSGTSTLSLGANQSIAALTGASTSTVALGGTTLTVGKTTGTTTFAGAITGSSGSLTKDGASIQILSGTNTYTGTTTINSGTLALGSGGSLSDLTAVVVNSPGSFDISGISSSERIASLSGASGSTLKLGAKTLEFGDATDTSFAGSVESDSGGTLKKIGIGTFTLTASGYTGTGPNINISQGTLLTGVDNLLPSSAFTLSGGTLATGTFSNTVGSLSVTSDSVINFAGGGTPVFTFASQGTWSGVLSVWNWSGSAWSSGTGGQLKFLDGSDGAILDGTKVKFYSGSGTGLISEGGGFIGTELVPVPEPTTLLSCSLLLGVIGFQRRRKGSRSIES